ncbi:Neuronal acetylcholine receptor subunit alpha-10, partial [Temnothorax longispinosus]
PFLSLLSVTIPTYRDSHVVSVNSTTVRTSTRNAAFLHCLHSDHAYFIQQHSVCEQLRKTTSNLPSPSTDGLLICGQMRSSNGILGTAGTVEHYGDTACIIFHDGQVLWVPPAQFIGLCELDLRLWPFDTQVCNMTFGSWTYHGEQIDMRLSETENMERMYVKNAGWKLMDLSKSRESVVYSCCAEPYINLNFKMTLKRNSALYCSILLMPAAAIAFLVLVTFWLPPQSEMKISVAACTILIIAVFLGYLGLKVPLTATPPLIVYFYSGCLCLETISLTLSIVVINMSKRVYCKPLPRNIRLCLLSWPGKLLGLSDLISLIESRRPMPGQELRGKLTEESTTNSTSNISDEGDRQNIISPTKNTTQLQWILAGIAIDRIAFVLFCLILATMAILSNNKLNFIHILLDN